jgi:hypothetical protein
VEQLEEQVRSLLPEDLAQFVVWQDGYVGRAIPGSEGRDAEGDDLSEEERAELHRRRAEILADPSLARPMDDEYFDPLKRQLRDAPPQRASRG